MARYFKTAHENSGQKFIISKFEHSFRSGESVLGAVDEVFKPANVALSVSSERPVSRPHRLAEYSTRCR